MPATRRYLLVVAAGNLVWEVARLPLYTIWREGTPGEIAFAVVHGTGGDLLIATACLTLALLLFGRGWPEGAPDSSRHPRSSACATHETT